MTSVAGNAGPQTDLELLERVRAGEQHAMVALFDRYGRLVYTVALRVLHDPAAAEDVMQDVFLKIWKDVPRLQARGATLHGWFGILARNRAIDLLRHKDRLPVSEEVVLSTPGNVAMQAESRILYDRACRIIGGLPQEQQTVLKLAYFDGLSHSEISDQMQSPLGTVKSRLRQALQTIRKAAGL